MPNYNLVTYLQPIGMEQLAAELKNPEISDLILMPEVGDGTEQILAQYANISDRQDIYSGSGGPAIVHIILGTELKGEPE